MIGSMQKPVLCIARRFLTLRVGIVELPCVRMVDRFGKSKFLAVMFECMSHPIRIKVSYANAGHQDDQHHKTENLPGKKWIVHGMSLAWVK